MEEKTTPTPRRRRAATRSTEAGSGYNQRFSAGDWRAILEEVGRERYEQLRIKYLKSR